MRGRILTILCVVIVVIMATVIYYTLELKDKEKQEVKKKETLTSLEEETESQYSFLKPMGQYSKTLPEFNTPDNVNIDTIIVRDDVHYFYTDFGDFTIFNKKSVGEFDFAADGLGEYLRKIVKDELPDCSKMEMKYISEGLVYFDAEGHELTFDVYTNVIYFEGKEYAWGDQE